MASVVSVNVSEKKGEIKVSRPSITLVKGFGIQGDAHGGAWHRQVSLLADESVETMRSKCPIPLEPGVFAENITTRGIDLKDLPVGTVLRVGGCLLAVTQIGKQCHNDCAIRRQVGTCVMPTDGIFTIVLKGGVVKPGDEIEVVDEETL